MLGFSPLASSALSDRGVRILDASASTSCTSSLTSAGQRIALGASLNTFDPESGLTLDYEFSEAELSGTTIDTPEYSNTAWPSRNQNTVIAFESTLPSSFSTNTDGFLTIGGNGTGTWAGVITDADGQKKYWVTSGDGQSYSGFDALGDAAADRVRVSDISEFDGNSHTVVIDIRINPGRIRSWIDGRLVLEGNTTGGGQLEGNQHSGNFHEKFGQYAQCRGVQTTGNWSGTIGSDLRLYANELVGENNSTASQAFTDAGSQRVREAESTIACSGSVTSEGTRVREASATVTASSTVTMTSGSVLRPITPQNINAVATVTAASERIALVELIVETASTVVSNAERIKQSSATVTASSTVTSDAQRIQQSSSTIDTTVTTEAEAQRVREADASATPSATVTAVGNRVQFASADISAVATNTSEAERIQQGASNIASVSSINAVGQYTAKGEADIDALASISSAGQRIHLASCQADSTTVTITVGRKKWEATASTGQSYASQQLDSQSWNQKTQTSQDYVQVGDDSQNWSTISKTSADWSDIAA